MGGSGGSGWSTRRSKAISLGALVPTKSVNRPAKVSFRLPGDRPWVFPYPMGKLQIVKPYLARWLALSAAALLGQLRTERTAGARAQAPKSMPIPVRAGSVNAFFVFKGLLFMVLLFDGKGPGGGHIASDIGEWQSWCGGSRWAVFVFAPRGAVLPVWACVMTNGPTAYLVILTVCAANVSNRLISF